MRFLYVTVMSNRHHFTLSTMFFCHCRHLGRSVSSFSSGPFLLMQNGENTLTFFYFLVSCASFFFFFFVYKKWREVAFINMTELDISIAVLSY